MKPSSRRLAALALLALAGSGAAQNMGQWVGGQQSEPKAPSEAERIECAETEWGSGTYNSDSCPPPACEPPDCLRPPAPAGLPRC
jgi:hypothetical protein